MRLTNALQGVQVLGWLLSVKLKIAFCSYQKIRPSLGVPMGKNSVDRNPASKNLISHLDSDYNSDYNSDYREAILKTQRLIARAERRLPFKCQCLVVAIVAHRLLKSMGVPSQLYLGVAKGHLTLKAHAWVQVGEAPVVGVSQGVPLHTVVQVFE